MSDFLSHLSARSLSSNGGAIQPRLRARFEPFAPVGPMPVDLASEVLSSGVPEVSLDETAQNRAPVQDEVQPLNLSSAPDPEKRTNNEPRKKRAVEPPDHASVQSIHDYLPPDDINAQRAARAPSYRFSEDQDAVTPDVGAQVAGEAEHTEPHGRAPVPPVSTQEPDYRLAGEVAAAVFPTRPERDIPDGDAAAHGRAFVPPIPTQEPDYRLAGEVAAAIFPPQPEHDTLDEDTAAHRRAFVPPIPTQEPDYRLAEQVAAAIFPPRPEHDVSDGDAEIQWTASVEAHVRTLVSDVPSLQPAASIQPRPTPELPTLLENAPPEPTINISIGRIEVRAAPPPASPRPAREKARPGADLEAYLRQRSGGKHE